MRAARMLLPDVFSATEAPDMFFLAAAEGEPHLVGAAAAAWAPGGFPVEVHVVSPFRRRGIGRALIEAVAAAAADETDRLRSWSMVGEGSEAEAFLRATGFTRSRRFLGFETDGAKFAPIINVMRRWLERGGKIPPTARIVNLSEAPRFQLIRLVATELATLPATIAARIVAQETLHYDNDLSVVLMLDGKIGGAMLMTRSAGIARVEVNVVAPHLRHGWANVMILDEAARRAAASGLKRFRFFCDEHTRDTINVARRAGAASLGSGLFFERRLGPDQSSSSQS
ncbi:MAG TPA: GNAT family N-acetyltransferase [Alphaproteobacteria bacterium]|nr:GNAT family N-acetyltransferase [Alphaproteobacteria bacterium]